MRFTPNATPAIETCSLRGREMCLLEFYQKQPEIYYQWNTILYTMELHGAHLTSPEFPLKTTSTALPDSISISLVLRGSRYEDFAEYPHIDHAIALSHL